MGDCWDNSTTESFCGKFKTEHMFWEKYETKEKARRNIFEWIEIDYNRKRIYSAIGYVTPEKFEEDNRMRKV